LTDENTVFLVCEGKQKRQKGQKRQNFRLFFAVFALFASTAPLTAGGSIPGAKAHFYSARSASTGSTRVTRRAGK
jgi:hypothetical protein